MLLPESLVTSESKLLLKTVSGFCGPATVGCCVDVRGPFCQQKPHRCLNDRSVAMLVSEDCVAMGTIMI